MPQTLHDWLKREGLTSSKRERLRQLERENKELRLANEMILKLASFFCPGGAKWISVRRCADFFRR